MTRGGTRVDLDHYLEVLLRKPGAQLGATALEQGRAAGRFTAIHDAWWEGARKTHGDAASTRAFIEGCSCTGTCRAREVGFRRIDGQLVPIVHAKLMLLGRVGWTDDHPPGGVADDFYVVPEQLWIGSANLAQRSRASLEMGMWTADPQLVSAARAWLLTLVGLSEPLGSAADVLDPQFVPVKYDDAAIAEHLRDLPGAALGSRGLRTGTPVPAWTGDAAGAVALGARRLEVV